MAITLDGITLPDLIWEDEYQYQSVVGETSYSVTGALIVEESQALAGRPITLVSGSEGGWATRATVDALRAKAETAGLSMPLSLHGTPHTVAFRRNGVAVEAKPVVGYSDPDATTHYKLSLRLMEI